MKIQHDNSPSPATVPAGRTVDTQAAGRAGRYASGDAGLVTGQDEVQLSNLAGRIAGSGRVSAAERSARVEALTRQVQAGRYTVDAHKVSEKIVGAALRQGSPK